MAVNFDKSYWPDCGTVVPSIPEDLNELWEYRADQAAVFVAEAIIQDEPSSHVMLEGGTAKVETFLWSVGGDTLTVEEDLSDLIRASARVYEVIVSPAQEQDVVERLSSLDAVEKSLAEARSFLSGQLTAYRTVQTATDK